MRPQLFTGVAVAVVVLLSSGCKKDVPVPALTETNDGKYHVGEKWKFNSRPGEEGATLTVVKVESADKLGVIVHISVEGIRLKSPHSANGFAETIAHMPFAEAAIEKSVSERAGKGEPLPSFDEGYRQWRTAFDAHKAGVFTITVGEGVAFMEKALNP